MRWGWRGVSSRPSFLYSRCRSYFQIARPVFQILVLLGAVPAPPLAQIQTHLRDTDDHVLDQRLDGPQACDVLSGTVPDRELDLVVLGGLDLGVSA